MAVNPRLVSSPTRLWRVGRTPNPLNFSQIAPEDAANAPTGNRFDVPGGEVLYAASDAEGAFAETLSRYRPTAAMRQLRAEPDEHFMLPGAIPADWRTKRQLVNFALRDPLPFLDVDAPETHTFLTERLSQTLEGLSVDNLDIAVVRGSNRFVTRAIAQWAFAATDEDGFFLYSGIRYQSRLGPYECWAIFGGAELIDAAPSSIAKTNAEILEIARVFGLTIH